MRYDGTHKANTRENLVSKASTRLRQDGINAVGLRALLADAGLTHGAFYAHFSSKEKLVEAAVEKGLEDTYSTILSAIEDISAGQKLEAFVCAYLNEAHWKSFEHGCIVPALITDISRGSKTLRQQLTDGIQPIITLLEQTLPAGGNPSERALRATTIFTGMAGSLQFARSCNNENQAKALLINARHLAIYAAKAPWE